MRCRLARDYFLESARQLTGVPSTHPCARLHGHSFKVTLTVEGEVEADTGWLMDFASIDERFEPLRKILDHAHLNAVEGLENPTSEHLSAWIWQRLKPTLPELIEIAIAETEATRCVFRGEGL